MSHELVILAGADDDMLRKHVELDAFSEELANSFAADTQEALDLISQNPFIGSAHSHSPFRKWLLMDWDMAIFYRSQGSRCYVHAVLSLRQDPKTVLTTLKKRDQP
ncbi:type II toxin-antitoxin system RelE/ParE family toxin [Prosthecobacter sp.]|uniref:type II toxin-antitoxin system RelE/ParE family toxin n=1 Tax=Prosthecobacter sp. TaxID=1965333 RepID=UPI003784B365